MNLFVGLFSEPWVQRLGWVLIHFLWQGTAIALLLAVALRLLTRASSHVRYVAIGGALLTCAIMPVVTWTILGSSPTPPAAFSATAPNPAYVANVEAPATLHSNYPLDVTDRSPDLAGIGWRDRLHQAADAALPYVVCLWFGGVLILTLRLTLVWTLMRRLCLSGLPVMDSLCQERFRNLLERMQITLPVRLLESALVEVPTLIGWLRPTILVPASVFTGLSPDQLEAILAHELAHVRRYDYLVNLFQTVIETILFYHPAVWWISRKLREERENCCDDLALDVMQNRLVYVSALAQLEQTRALPPALTASGGSLLHRIRRIAGVDSWKSSLVPIIVTVLIVGLLALPLVGQVSAKVDATTGTTKSDANAQMLQAVQKGDAATLQKLIDQGVDPKTVKNDQVFVQQVVAINPPDFGLLQFLCKLAANNGETDEYTLLSEKIKSLPGQSDWRLDDGTILEAVARGDRPVVQAIIDQGWDLNKYSVMRLSGAAAQSPGMREWLITKGVKIPEFTNGERLIDAADREDIPEMEHLLKAGVDINYQGESGWTPLTKAAEANKVQSVKFLLAHGANPNSTKSPGYNYSGMCLTGKPEIADMLLAAGGNINATLFNRGVHIIDYPITFGPTEMVKWFIAHGVDPTKAHADDPCPTFLFEAANPEIAEILIQHGVDVHARDKNGDTALSQICGYGNKPAEIARVLLKYGADPNAQDDYGVTPLMRARDGATVDVLIGHGAYTKTKNKSGLGVLMMTSNTADATRLEALLKHGVPFDPKTDGPQMLLNAIGNDQLDIMAFLLNHGVDPNQKADWFKGTYFAKVKPLLRAVISGRYDAVQFLLEHGAKTDDEIFFAMNQGRTEMVKLFWDSGVRSISKLCYQVNQGASLSDVQKLLDQGSPANPRQDKIVTPLGEAARLGNMAVVQLLVQHGADVNAGGILNPQYPQSRLSPLQMAASEGQNEITKYLLDHGARADPWALERAANNSNPYPYQRSKDHFEQVVKLLIDAGTLREATPKEAGCILAAPIQTSAGGSNATVLKMLLDAGISPESPMPYIVENGEKPNSVIGYYRDYCQKYANDPSYTEAVAGIKPLLNMLEAVDKGSAPKPTGASNAVDHPAVARTLVAAAKQEQDEVR